MSGQFTPRYSQAQKEAVIHARLDRGMAAPRVAQLAKEGMLKGPSGDRLEAFEIPVQSVYKYAANEKRKRAGKAASVVATLPPEDAVEILRRRLLTVADRALKYEEKRKDGQLDLERLRQIARAAREAAHLTAPGNQRPRQPGQREDGKVTEGQTRGGLADAILKAAQQAEGGTAQDNPPTSRQDGDQLRGKEGAPTTTLAENGGNREAERSDAATDDAPGSLASAIAARFTAELPTT